MSYIYDIVLNFNKLYYDFYEWRDSDDILNIRRIPAFRVDEKSYIDIKYNDVVVDKFFCDVIKDKCLSFSVDNSMLSCLISDGREVMGILLDDNGNVMGKSSLIFDEEEDVLTEIGNTEVHSINYEVRVYNDKRIYSRSVMEKFEYLKCFFNSNNSIDIYKYIYYDLYEKEENDITKIRDRLLKLLEDGWNSYCDKLYFCIKMLNGVGNK